MEISILEVIYYIRELFSLPAEQFNKLNTNGVNSFSGRGLVSYIPNQLTICLLLKQNAKFQLQRSNE